MRLGGLETEARASALADLDLRDTPGIVQAILAAHDDVVSAVQAAEAQIAALVDAVAERPGRVIYVGAGSAGRLAAVDASEWGPTYSFDRVTALVAGADHEPGSRQEAAAEDDAEAGESDVRAMAPTADDVVIAVSASGRTPYALGGLQAAGDALRGAIVCTHGSPLARMSDHTVEVLVGPEPIAGSTRLKAGTAQKLILNAFSTTLMVRRGKTLGDLMTSMRVANDKLRDRATRITMAAAECDEPTARKALQQADDDIEVAVVMVVRGATAGEARRLLEEGTLRQVVRKWS